MIDTIKTISDLNASVTTLLHQSTKNQNQQQQQTHQNLKYMKIKSRKHTGIYIIRNLFLYSMVQQQQQEENDVTIKHAIERKNEHDNTDDHDNDEYKNNHHDENDDIDADYVEPKCCYDDNDNDGNDDNDEIIIIDHDENDDNDDDNDDENGGNIVDNHYHEDIPKDEDDNNNANKLLNGIIIQKTQLKNKVDRNWLQKLLRKYWYTTQYQQQTRDGNTTNKNSTILPLPSTNYKINAYICAPMVDQSDLPFRLLCRQYGCNIGYTPMIHAKLFQTSSKYKNTFLPYKHIPFLNTTTTTNNTNDTNTNTSDITHMDRPLIGQICGSSIEYVIKTAIELSHYVDGIDINCGCPQNIAKRGNYGAYLLEQEIYLLTLLQQLNTILTIPVSVKVRLLPPSKNIKQEDCKDQTSNTNDTNNINTKEQIERNDSINRSMVLYEKLIHIGGVHMICIHGRTRYQKGIQTGQADWDAMKLVVNTFHQYIPIIGNGSIASQYDIYQCIEYTNVDGIMCSEALLEYPPIYSNLIQYDYYNYYLKHKKKKENKLLLNTNNNNSDNNNNNDNIDSNTFDDVDDDIMLYLDEMFQTKKSKNNNNIMVNGIQLALEYYNIAKKYKPNIHGQGSNTIKVIKIHIHRFCHYYLQNNIHIRQLLINAQTLDELYTVIVLLNEQYNTNNNTNTDSNVDNIDSIDNTNDHDTNPNNDHYINNPSNHTNLIVPPLSWYYRHRYKVQDCFGITRNNQHNQHSSNDNNINNNDTTTTTTLLQEQMRHESTVKSTTIETLLVNDNNEEEEDCIMDLLFQNE